MVDLDPRVGQGWLRILAFPYLLAVPFDRWLDASAGYTEGGGGKQGGKGMEQTGDSRNRQASRSILVL